MSFEWTLNSGGTLCSRQVAQAARSDATRRSSSEEPQGEVRREACEWARKLLGTKESQALVYVYVGVPFQARAKGSTALAREHTTAAVKAETLEAA